MTKNQGSDEHILTVAERLIQSRGYNAFSYRDIAEEVQIKTSSIHYYFPAKADLGKAVVQRHLEGLAETLKPLLEDEKLSFAKKLGQVIDTLVAKTYGDHQKMCLGGMLAADALTLPEPIKKEVRHFFTRIAQWFRQMLTEAVERKEIQLEKRNIAAEAAFILALFEGSLLLARLYKDEGYLAAARRQIMARFSKD